MSTISTANFTTLVDNVAKTLVDIESAFVTNPTSNAPTIATITSGQTGASNSLSAHVLALADLQQENDLSPSAYSTTAAVVAALAIAKASYYSLYTSFIVALDKHVAGINAFCTANSLQVHAEFAGAVNYVAGLGSSAGRAVTAMSPANVFIPANQTLFSGTVSGATTISSSDGTSIDTTLYAPAKIYLKNTGGSPSTGTATAFTINYKNAAGATVTSSPYTIGGAVSAGASVDTGLVGSDVNSWSITAGGTGDTWALTVVPLRAVAY